MCCKDTHKCVVFLSIQCGSRRFWLSLIISIMLTILLPHHWMTDFTQTTDLHTQTDTYYVFRHVDGMNRPS